MNTALSTAIAALVLLVSLMAITCPLPVRADPADSISFDSGVTIFSPLKTTYHYKKLVLDLSLAGAGLLGSVDPNISMKYSIDGIYNGSVPLRSTGEIHVVSRAVGTVDLPELPDGSHYLTIYLYGLNQRAHEPKYVNYVNTVYFSTVGNPLSSPTESPALTPAPSPTIPEDPSSLILPLFMIATLAVALTTRKKLNERIEKMEQE